MHKNIILRSAISFIRSEMLKLGFLEYQINTTSSSPEGARDFGSKQIKSRKILCVTPSTPTI